MTERALAIRFVLACGLVSGCAHQPHIEAGARTPVLESRDAFYDGARLIDNRIVVVGKHGKVVFSDDEGRSWTLAASGTHRPLFGVAFVDGSTGVAVGGGGTYLRSNDGGATWSEGFLGVDRELFLVRFTNGIGIIVGEFGTLLRSDTSGRSWERVELPWGDLMRELEETLGPVEPHLHDVAFCDDARGWIVGEYGLILASADAGRTWQKQRRATLHDSHLFAVACVGPKQLVAAGQAGKLLYTADEGATWLDVPSPRRHDLYDVVPLSPSGEVLALGDLGTVLVSADAGRPGSWTPFPEPAPGVSELGHAWMAIGLPSAGGLIVAGESRLARLDMKTTSAVNSSATTRIDPKGS